MAINGQLWYLTQGADTDTRLVFVNDDGTSTSVVVQSTSGTLPFVTITPQDVAIDTAAGLYYVLSNNGVGSAAHLYVGHIGSNAAPTLVTTYVADDIVNAIQIDPINHRLYVGYTEGTGGDGAHQGIIQYNYDPATGATALSGGTVDNSFVITQTHAQVQSSVSDGLDLMDVRDFAFDASTNSIYFAQLTDGDGFESNMIWRVDLDTPNAAAVPVLQQSQFALNNDGTNLITNNGFIIDVEIDAARGLLYFSTYEQHPGSGNLGQNAIWVIGLGASGSTAATKVTLSGVNTTTFYPGDMTYDPVNHLLYVESEQTVEGNGGGTDDAILVFQLNSAGTAATLIRTISPTFNFDSSNIGGMTFTNLVHIGTMSGTSTHALGTGNLTLLASDPNITDVDGGYLTGATVKIGGSFAGSGDALSVNGVTSGTIAGTSIVVTVTIDGNGNPILTLSGYDTIAHYEQVLGDIRFNAGAGTAAGSNSSRTVTWQLDDGTLGDITDINGSNVGQTTFQIDVNAAPVLHVTHGTTPFVESGTGTSTPVVIDSSVTISDTDNATLASARVSIGANFQAGADVLAFTNNPATMGNIGASYNAGTGVLTLTSSGATATLAQWQAALRSVTFTNTSDTPNTGARIINFTVNDGHSNSAVDNLFVSVAATNDAPVIDVSGAVAHFTEGNNVPSTPVVLDGSLVITDVDSAALASATVSITGNFHSGEDVLSFTNNPATMGNITALYNAATGVMSLTSAGGTATFAQWHAALRSVTYSNNSDSPDIGDRLVSFVVSDGTTDSLPDVKTVQVTAVDDSPIVVTSGGSAAFTESADPTSTPVAIDSGISLSDADSTTLSHATVSNTGNYHSGEDVLNFANNPATMGNISALFDSGTGVMTLFSSGGTATLAQWQAALRSVTYLDSSDTPDTSTRSITFVVNDGTSDSVAGTRTVAVTAANDAPAVTVPASIAVAEDASTVISGISFVDPDALNSTVSATLSVGSGTLTATSGSGVIIGGAPTNMTLTGTLAAINAFIAANSIHFTTAANATGDVVLSIVIDDGSSGVHTDSTTLTLAVSAVNDAPTITVPASITVTEDVRTAISGISFADVDAGSNVVTATLSIVSGALSATSGSGVTVGGTATAMTLSGSIAEINAFIAANSVGFTSATNATGNAVLTVVIDDGGHVGSGGVLTATQTVTLDIAGVNDAPVNTLPASQSMFVHGDLVLSGTDRLSIADVDAGNGAMQVTLTATHGTMALNGFAGLTFTAGSGGGDTTMTFTGTIAAINAALNGLTYSADANYDGPGSIQITTSDQGASGSGGAQTDTDTLAIDIVPPNQSPVLSSFGATRSFVEGAAVAVLPALTITDDGTTLHGATVTLSGGFAGSGDILASTLSGGALTALGITASYNAGTGVMTLSGTASIANYEAALKSITFNSGQNPDHLGTDLSRTVTLLVDDGQAYHPISQPGVVTISVTGVNDAPSGANKTIAILEDNSRTLVAADFGFSDVEGHSLMAVRIASLASVGTLKLNGVAIAAGTLVSIADINAGKLVYLPALNGTGSPSFTFQVQDNGGTANGGVNIDGSPNAITFAITPVNDAPTAVVLSDLKTSLAENTAVTSRIKVATIAVTDVDGGNNILSLGGSGSAIFEIIGNALYLKAGASLNFETKNSYALDILVNDPTIAGNTIELSKPFVFNITDVNEKPDVSLAHGVTVLAEDVSTATARGVADIVVTDDALGTHVLSLSGADAAMFQIVGTKLMLKAGVKLDFETNPVLDVNVLVDDHSTTGIDDTAAFRLTLRDGVDTLAGTVGNDVLTGFNGVEILNGNAGNDTLNGLGGNDRLNGGAGVDRLTGGGGSDVFIFSAPTDSGYGYTGSISNSGAFSQYSGQGARDIITDFTHGADTIDFSAIDARSTQAGNQAFAFKGAANFSHIAGELIYKLYDTAGTANDKTVVYGDLNGDGRADFQVELTGLHHLVASDFLL